MFLLPRRVLGTLRENRREFGFRETLERSVVWFANRALGSTLHRHSRVPLSAFAENAVSTHFSADSLAQAYLFPQTADLDLLRTYSEYQRLRGEIAARYNELAIPYPRSYAVEDGSAFLLYALVRSLRPAIVLETGVANGHSSFFILNAMRANRHGLLHSIDRSGEVGWLLSREERERWRLHVLPKKNLKRSFSQILDSLPPLDVFLHDSDHSYSWQSFELRTALKKLNPGGVLASDDCDCGYAFLDVCQASGLRPVVLVDARKIFGLVFLAQQRQASSPLAHPPFALSE